MLLIRIFMVLLVYLKNISCLLSLKIINSRSNLMLIYYSFYDVMSLLLNDESRSISLNYGNIYHKIRLILYQMTFS